MKLFPIIISGSTLFMASCAALQKGATVGIGATAGALGAYEATDGNPLWTAAGAIGGAAVGVGVNALADANTNKEASAAYAKSQNDSIKQHYWMLQNYQEHYTDGGGVTNTYEVLVPANKDLYGVKTVPREATIRIVE